jgi:hypothetical protein
MQQIKLEYISYLQIQMFWVYLYVKIDILPCVLSLQMQLYKVVM